MFAFLIDVLNENGRGIHAHRRCAERGFAAMAENPGAEAAFYLLAQSAESFADMNERMPISSGDIEAAFERFRNSVETLDAAWQGGSEADRLTALNNVARSAAERHSGAE